MNFSNVFWVFAIVLATAHSAPFEGESKTIMCSMASSVPFGCNIYCTLSVLTGLSCDLTNCLCRRSLLGPNLLSLPVLPTFSNLSTRPSSCDLQGKLICNIVCSTLLFNGGSTCTDEGCYCNGTSLISPPPPNSFSCDKACEGICELITLNTGKCIEKKCVCS